MIRLYLIREYRDIYPELASGALSEALILDILRREGVEDPHILRTDRGKPYEKDEKIRFSVSHTDDIFACAVGYHELGLDIQSRGPAEPKKISDRFFTADEKDLFDRATTGHEVTDCSGDIGRPGPRSSMIVFLRIWTRKEALIKYRGSTLSEMLSSESVLDRDDVDFIDLDLGDTLIGCLCIPEGEDGDVEIVRYKADEVYGCQRKSC